MNNLLDTHTAIWFIEGNKNISEKAITLIEADDSNNFISIVSLWEISIKHSLGRVIVKTSLQDFYDIIDSNGFLVLPINLKHTLNLVTLQNHHRDPFDRMIISQAMVENLTLISGDKYFRKYDINLIW